MILPSNYLIFLISKLRESSLASEWAAPADKFVFSQHKLVGNVCGKCEMLSVSGELRSTNHIYFFHLFLDSTLRFEILESNPE